MKYDGSDCLRPDAGVIDDYDVLVVDTEFSRLPLPSESLEDWSGRCVLLSVGICPLSDSGGEATFYARRRLQQTELNKCSDFVVREVLPHLQAAEADIEFRGSAELRQELARWLSERRRLTAKMPAFAADWAGERFLLRSLLPGNTPWVILSLLPDLDVSMSAPRHQNLKRHNALHDAMVQRSAILQMIASA